MAKAPFEQHKSKRKLLRETAMKCCPFLWFAPAIVRAHDKSEYEKDRKYVQDVYVGYQEHHRSRKNSCLGAGGRGSIVDLNIYPAPVDWAPGVGARARRDLWPVEKVLVEEKEKEEDPWQLLPMNEIV